MLTVTICAIIDSGLLLGLLGGLAMGVGRARIAIITALTVDPYYSAAPQRAVLA